MGQESAERWTAQADVQPGPPESDRLLGAALAQLELALRCGAERLSLSAQRRRKASCEMGLQATPESGIHAVFRVHRGGCIALGRGGVEIAAVAVEEGDAGTHMDVPAEQRIHPFVVAQTGLRGDTGGLDLTSLATRLGSNPVRTAARRSR